MDEELEASAAALRSEVRVVKAWVELEKARIAGDTAPRAAALVDGFDEGVANYDPV